MALKRSEFWEWMNTCPSKEWCEDNLFDDGEGVRIWFTVEEDKEEAEGLTESN